MIDILVTSAGKITNLRRVTYLVRRILSSVSALCGAMCTLGVVMLPMLSLQ
jgi:hypothetical protein